jgi:carbonic anhydrase
MPTKLLSDILEHNQTFVRDRQYEPFITDSPPNKKLIVVTCMDSRLIELLPRAMNLHNGDVKLLKTAGGVVSHPFGSIMRSILVAVYDLGAQEIAIVGHHGCGMAGLNGKKILEKARNRGISDETVQTLTHAGIDLTSWLVGFDKVQDAVRQSVEVVKHHPLLPQDIAVHGLVIHPETGKLDVLVDGTVAK